MNYRAACPHCASVFRLGDDQLAAAQGWVQCGVCGAAFDARLSLRLEDGSTLPHVIEPAPTTPPATSRPETRPAETVAEVQPAPPDATGEAGALSAPADDAASATAIGLPHGVREREDPLELPSIILIDPNLPGNDEPGPMPDIRPEPAPAPAATLPPPSVPAPSAPAAARIEYAHPAPVRPARRRARKPWLGGLAALLLSLALFAQLAWFQRDRLATQFPQLRPALEQACAQLGCTLSLPKQLDQIRIVGSDLTTEASGQLRLDLTLGNRARHAMAWPVLVLTLTDQAGRPLARRSFAPSEYLADASRIRAGMPATAEQALSLPLAVQDLAPMGFDLRLAY
ncbi:MAG: zinc-ribbon domain-containing protein [Thiobacillus sp.]|nr:zinc-ribbon domain-containing protein [Thiobacillus sp.]